MANPKEALTSKESDSKTIFYKIKEGKLERKGVPLGRHRIKTDGTLQRTKERMLEFGKALKGSNRLRNALRPLLQNIDDDRMKVRLLREFNRIIKTDTLNPSGMRNIEDGEMEMLQGFEFNAKRKLVKTLYAPFTTDINRVTGELRVYIPSFIPSNMVAAPPGATHYKITFAGVEMDFNHGTYLARTKSTPGLPWNAVATAPIALVTSVTAKSTKPLILVLGIEFPEHLNGLMAWLKIGNFNAAAVVRVSRE